MYAQDFRSSNFSRNFGIVDSVEGKLFVCFAMNWQTERPRLRVFWLPMFDFSPVCIFKCLLKLTSEQNDLVCLRVLHSPAGRRKVAVQIFIIIFYHNFAFNLLSLIMKDKSLEKTELNKPARLRFCTNTETAMLSKHTLFSFKC